ncbi:MAG: RNA polymerase sigma factor [Gammaproteobacteria bacterium]|jgi:RNA polymerase sigma-70 factor (ECF subfamily)|nr:RNA polymerase sigma factor [Gammaproteobacteria bacterium]MDP6695239.1 RNA polymerase sigma factor [Gammaproteobacteria bacterium]
MLETMAAELNDTALMLRYRDGDVDAFEALYNRHRGALFRYLVRRIGNQAFAEDIFQEVWSRIIRNRKSYRPSAKFTTYMFHIAHNCSVDHYRRSGKHDVVVSDQDDSVPEPAASTGNPVAAAEASEMCKTLTDALNTLPVEQREAFLLHEESGLTLEEIGNITGVGRETVKSRLRYALGKLRQCVPRPEAAGMNDD